MKTGFDEHQQMVDDCEKRESRLTDWEQGFIDSIGMQLERGRSLSAKQLEILNKLWERATENG